MEGYIKYINNSFIFLHPKKKVGESLWVFVTGEGGREGARQERGRNERGRGAQK